MKRFICLLATLAAIAISTTPLYADDMGKMTEMSGMLCNSKCVTQSTGHAACDASCADKSGDVVLVDDQGKVFKIENQDKVISHAGKKVKVKCKPVKGKPDTMSVDSLYLGG